MNKTNKICVDSFPLNIVVQVVLVSQVVLGWRSKLKKFQLTRGVSKEIFCWDSSAANLVDYIWLRISRKNFRICSGGAQQKNSIPAAQFMQFQFICGSFDFPRLCQWQGKYQCDDCFCLVLHLHNIINFTSNMARNKDDALLAMIFVYNQNVHLLQLLMPLIHCNKMNILSKWAVSELKLN